jgi:hypothetical protein
VEILDVFSRRLQSEIILRGARRNSFLHQPLDPFDQEFLFLR